MSSQEWDEETIEIIAQGIERGLSRALANFARVVVEMLWQDKERVEAAIEKMVEANR